MLTQSDSPHGSLHSCIIGRDVACVAGLLASGVSPDTADADGQPAIWIASAVGDEEIVRLLLRAGANPNARSPSGTPVLTQAVARSSERTAIDLLHAGADVNARDSHGATALICAAEGRDLRLVRLLLEVGADPGLQAYDGRTALSVGSWQVVETRVEGRRYYRRGVRVDSGDPLIRALIDAAAIR